MHLAIIDVVITISVNVVAEVRSSFLRPVTTFGTWAVLGVGKATSLAWYSRTYIHFCCELMLPCEMFPSEIVPRVCRRTLVSQRRLGACSGPVNKQILA